MSQLARLRREIKDSNGLALAGVNVDVRKQGTSIDGAQSVSSGATIDIKHPGALIASTGTVRVYRNNIEVDVGPGLGTLFTVGALTASTVALVWGGGGASFEDEDRLVWDQDASVFEDTIGQDPEALPLSSTANGLVAAWARGNSYDLVVSGGAVPTPYIEQDAFIFGEYNDSNVFDGATAIGWIFNTTRALSTAGAKLLSFRNNDVEKAFIDKDGLLSAIGVTLPTGDLTVMAGQIIMAAGASQLVPGVTSFALRDNGDANDNLLVLDNGDTTVRGDLTVGGGIRSYIGLYAETNIAGSATTLLNLMVEGTNTLEFFVAMRAGSVTGISVSTSLARTAGTATVEVKINGVGTGLTAVLDGTNTQFKATTQDAGLDTFVSGDRITVELVTSSFTPIPDLGSTVEIVTA